MTITGTQDSYDPITMYIDSEEPVNVSNTGIGVDNQYINPGEVLSVKFYSYSGAPLSITSLGFTVDHLANDELAYFTLYSGGQKVGTSISKTGATGSDSSGTGSETFISVTAVDAEKPAGTPFDEVRFEKLDSSDFYRLLFTSLTITTDPLDQQIVIPYTVTDADGDTASDMFNVSFLNTVPTIANTRGSDNDTTVDGLARVSMLSASAFVPGEQIEGDNIDGEDWLAEQAGSAEGGEEEGDGAGLVVTPGEEETGSSDTPDSADETGSGLMADLSDATLGDSEDSGPVAAPESDGTDVTDQSAAVADTGTDTSDQPAAADGTDQPADGAPDVVADADQPADSTEGETGDADQPAVPDAAVQAVASVDAATGETGEVAGTTDTGLGDDAPPAEVAASEAPESETQGGLGESEAGTTDLLTTEVTGSPEELPGTDATDTAEQPTETADSGEPEGAVTEDPTGELFADAGGEDEVSTDPSDADLDAGGLDNGLDIDTLVDPGSGQNA